MLASSSIYGCAVQQPPNAEVHFRHYRATPRPRLSERQGGSEAYEDLLSAVRDSGATEAINEFENRFSSQFGPIAR